MNTKMKMRMLSLLLCFVMLVGLMPTTAFAWSAPTLSGGKAAWNVQLSDEGVLTWNDMGSTTYDIQVDKTALGGTVTKIQGISGTSYNLINRFKELKIENGTYVFYIKAIDTDTTSGDITFTYVSPEAKLSEPQNLRWEGTTAKWDSVANATEYEVRLYSDSGSLQLSKTTSETQYDWSTNVYNDGFWFEVVAIGDNYRNSNAAEGPKYGTYSWTAPTLTGGKAEWNVTLSDDGMLRWNDMGSATYDIYVDETADLQMAVDIIMNGKVQRPGVCNATESLLVHKNIAEQLLPMAAEQLLNAGVELRGCPETMRYVAQCNQATVEDYATEFHGLILSVKVVESMEEAILHIRRYGTKHSEVIVTNDYANARKFQQMVDAAVVYVNASSRFSDGFQFGFGAEIGISTQKLHARGPMGLKALTSYKYIVNGDGQVRK